MRYNIKGKNFEIGDRTKEKIASKLDRLKKLFPEETTATVTITSEKLESIVEVTIPMSKRLLRAETSDADMMAAVDKAVDIMDGQIVKYKKRMRTKVRKNGKFKEEFESIIVEEAHNEDEDEIKFVRNKQFELRPMDAEEAVMQMELLGHAFFVYRNDENDKINVVYKRKNGTYGIIEPEY